MPSSNNTPASAISLGSIHTSCSIQLDGCENKYLQKEKINNHTIQAGHVLGVSCFQNKFLTSQQPANKTRGREREACAQQCEKAKQNTILLKNESGKNSNPFSLGLGLHR